ncbi:hypothetical protein [Streptomyces ginkgonis]|uniref:hypothetical protein n=1 Tax=Streptomyces ginkgonis TaxID=1812259 RepID=UPI002176C24B|nr:hypothetical protein [Streptomyces ginkgonis]
MTAPALCVLVDSHEGETPQEIKARKEKAFMELKERLDKFSVGDYVEATGVDTRGHTVKRAGKLLAEPKKVSAQRNGTRTAGWRLFVGLDGTDISTRSTWVTLFADQGTIERATEPTGWTNGELRGVPGIRSSNHKVRVLFGGKGGKRSAEPAKPRLAGITYTGDGRYELWDVKTQEVLLNCTLQTRVWWAPAPAPEQELVPETARREVPSSPEESDIQAPVSGAEPSPERRPAAPPARRGLLYEGWLASDGTRAVLHLETGDIIGWLTPDLASFIPAVPR